MKLKINRRDLLAALKHCSRLARKGNEIPVTDCVVIDMVNAEPTEQGEQLLRLRATDLEIWVEVHVVAEVETGGCIAPLCVNLERIVSAIPHEEVVISSQKDRIIVYPGDFSGKYPVNCLNADLFPVSDEESGDISEKRREAPREFLFENDGIIDRVLAKSGAKFEQGGDQEDTDMKNNLSFCDLGGKGLVISHFRGHTGCFEVSAIPITVGSFDCPVHGALLLSGLDSAFITVTDKWLVVKADNIFIAIRRGCGYSATENTRKAMEVISSFSNKIECNRFDLLGAIKRVKLCEEKGDSGEAVFLELGESSVVKGEEGGGVEELEGVRVDGNFGRVLLSTSFVERQLAVLGDNLSISFPDIGEGGVCQAICVRDLDNDDYLGFITGRMP